ncbi:cold shock domain-containing protein [Nocardioides sp. KR10-350]|uniref:cold-shock protein n=1 Tax=Nocardioides cheoyonin TaxID=3156615 RepID=UPI0032B4BFD8
MPVGKVKWFDAEKGFGFLSQDDGPDVYVHADALPAGAAKTLKSGTRVEFGIAQGRRGDQALSVRILDKPASVSRNQAAAKRKKPDEMVAIVEDLTKILERIEDGYRHGRHPDPKVAKKVGEGLRRLADEFDLL